MAYVRIKRDNSGQKSDSAEAEACILLEGLEKSCHASHGVTNHDLLVNRLTLK